MIENLIDQIFTLEGFSIEESKIPLGDLANFWHSNIIDNAGFSFSAGFGESRNLARQIAVAEFLERRFFKNISKNSMVSSQWGLDLIPTACGFAAGFDLISTRLRSINEALERWALSKWIDEDFAMNEIQVSDLKLSAASNYFKMNFDSVRLFEKEVLIEIGTKYYNTKVVASLGFKDEGVYLGSGYQKPNECLWQHALLESYRHLLVIKNSKVGPPVFPENRVRFFSKHKQVAIDKIAKSIRPNWPIPGPILHKFETFEHNQYFIARTIVDGWQSWSEGDVDRFLY